MALLYLVGTEYKISGQLAYHLVEHVEWVQFQAKPFDIA
jgi:hypothetical protein